MKRADVPTGDDNTKPSLPRLKKYKQSTLTQEESSFILTPKDTRRGLLPGWKACYDPNTGHYYYEHITTREMSYDPPVSRMEPMSLMENLSAIIPKIFAMKQNNEVIEIDDDDDPIIIDPPSRGLKTTGLDDDDVDNDADDNGNADDDAAKENNKNTNDTDNDADETK